MLPRKILLTAAALINYIHQAIRAPKALRYQTVHSEVSYAELPSLNLHTWIHNPNSGKGFNFDRNGCKALLSLLPPGHGLVSLTLEDILTPTENTKINTDKLHRAFTYRTAVNPNQELSFLSGQVTTMAVEIGGSNVILRRALEKLSIFKTTSEFKANPDFNYKVSHSHSLSACFRVPSHAPRAIVVFYTLVDTTLYLNIATADYLNGAEGRPQSLLRNYFGFRHYNKDRLVIAQETPSGNAINLLLLNMEHVDTKDFSIRDEFDFTKHMDPQDCQRIQAILGEEFSNWELKFSAPILNAKSYSDVWGLIDLPPTENNVNLVACIARGLENSTLRNARQVITDTLFEELWHYFTVLVPAGMEEVSTLLSKMPVTDDSVSLIREIAQDLPKSIYLDTKAYLQQNLRNSKRITS